MCQNQNIVSQTKNGILTFCKESKLFQLVYNNLCFELYEWELHAFKKYVEEIDIVYWENHLKCMFHQKRIPISTGTKHLVILIDQQEVFELRQLLHIDAGKVVYLDSAEIDYQFIEN